MTARNQIVVLANALTNQYNRLMRTFLSRHHKTIGMFLGYGIMGLVFAFAPAWLALTFSGICVVAACGIVRAA